MKLELQVPIEVQDDAKHLNRAALLGAEQLGRVASALLFVGVSVFVLALALVVAWVSEAGE